MKCNQLVGLVVVFVLMCFSGCITRLDVPGGRVHGEAKQQLYQQRKEIVAAATKLTNDFEVVFSNPAYLSLEDTSERQALYEHFRRMDEKSPSSEQVIRLIEVFKRQPRLLAPLRSFWYSHHITVTQRMEVAKMIDGLNRKDAKSAIPCREEFFSILLPRGRITVDEFQTLQRQVDPAGDVYAWTVRQMKKAEEDKAMAAKRMKELNALREASYR